MTTYSGLLSAARKRVQSPYSGPTAGELAAKVVLENLIISPTLAKFDDPFSAKNQNGFLSNSMDYLPSCGINYAGA